MLYPTLHLSEVDPSVSLTATVTLKGIDGLNFILLFFYSGIKSLKCFDSFLNIFFYHFFFLGYYVKSAFPIDRNDVVHSAASFIHLFLLLIFLIVFTQVSNVLLLQTVLHLFFVSLQ